jgi:hypothetical protein
MLVRGEKSFVNRARGADYLGASCASRLYMLIISGRQLGIARRSDDPQPAVRDDHDSSMEPVEISVIIWHKY